MLTSCRLSVIDRPAVELEKVGVESSHRQILRSSSLIGGASVFNILVGLVRLKAAALLLGPAGLGLIGLFQSFVSAASAVASLGMANVGTRQIAEAEAKGEEAGIAAARRALFWGTLVLAALGAAVTWAGQGAIARWLFEDETHARAIGWLGVAVALTVAAGSQGALLTGLRRIGDVARLSVAAAVVSGIAGVTALALLGERGIVLFVLTGPLASFLMGWFFASRLPRIPNIQTSPERLFGQWRNMAALGLAIMIGAAAMQGGQLLVRALVQSELGLASVGHFQAAWVLSITYLSFVLSAMGTDYYPRLTAAMEQPELANRLVNEQTEVALLLAGPVLLLMLGAAPWVLQLLYSSEFKEAAAVLRWQILGDVLKVASWPMGYLLLASGDGRTFAITEVTVTAVLLSFAWIGIPLLGLEAAGIAVLGMYVVYLPLIYAIAWRKTGFAWAGDVKRLFVRLCILALAVFAIAMASEAAASIVATLLAAVMLASAYGRLRHALPKLRR
jgi:PST family polysaccharide transporter